MTETLKKRVRGWPAHRATVYEHVYSSLDREVGGVLVGELLSDHNLSITGVIPALDAVGGAAEVTFTHESWEPIHRELDDRYPGKQIIGWYHSHPNFGVFLSEQDMFIHENFFSEWWQIAIVLDPVRCEEGFFFWKGGKGGTVTEVLKRSIDLDEVPPHMWPAGSPAPAPDADVESPRPFNSLGAWLLPLVVGGILGFAGAPSIGIGDSATQMQSSKPRPDAIAPADEGNQSPETRETPADTEGASQSESKPSQAECDEFTQRTGELLAGCPLSTLPG